jgi:hypothetical protein
VVLASEINVLHSQMEASESERHQGQVVRKRLNFLPISGSLNFGAWAHSSLGTPPSDLGKTSAVSEVIEE